MQLTSPFELYLVVIAAAAILIVWQRSKRKAMDYGDAMRHTHSLAASMNPQFKHAWAGAIHMMAEIPAFQSTPQFEALEQPVRCYLIGRDNGSFTFYWSKPGEFGVDGTFVTNAMKEDPPKNGEQYFNDAHRDKLHYDSTLTLTRHQAFGGRGFIYRQQFDDWLGAFAGHLDPIDPKAIPREWLDVFNERSAGL